MRRRIRPTTEDLEPRIVLSVGSLTPRTAEPPVTEDRTESPDAAMETPDAVDTSNTSAEPVDVMPIGTTSNSDTSTQTTGTHVSDTDVRTEPIDNVPDDVAAVDPDINLKRIARLKRLHHNPLANPTTTVGVVTLADVNNSEPNDTLDRVIPDTRTDVVVSPLDPVREIDADTSDDEVDTGLGDLTEAREITDGDESETTGTPIAVQTDEVSDASNVHSADVSVSGDATQDAAVGTQRIGMESRQLSFLEAQAERHNAEATDGGNLASDSATSWIDSLHSSTLSLLRLTPEAAGADVEPFAEQTASAAGVAGVLSLMAFGRKSMGDSERLFSGGLRGLLDLREWRATRSTTRRRQKSLPGPATRKEPVVVAPENLDEPELNDAFLMSVAVPVSPDAFAMSSIPADDDTVDNDDSASEFIAATAAVAATVAAGSRASRQRSSGQHTKPAPRADFDFGGTTFTRPRQNVG